MKCSNSDYRYMSIAADEAHKSSVLYRHGCLAVVSGKIMARGHNHYRSYSKDGLIKHACTCHAEIDVLRKCKRRNIRGKMTFYLARISESNGGYSNSFPCCQCLEEMKNFDVKTIVYSFKNGEIIKENVEDIETGFKSSGQIICEEIDEKPIKLSMTRNYD